MYWPMNTPLLLFLMRTYDGDTIVLGDFQRRLDFAVDVDCYSDWTLPCSLDILGDVDYESFSLIPPSFSTTDQSEFLWYETPLIRGVRWPLSAEISFEWKDQGWGNTRGQIWTRLVAGHDSGMWSVGLTQWKRGEQPGHDWTHFTKTLSSTYFHYSNFEIDYFEQFFLSGTDASLIPRLQIRFTGATAHGLELYVRNPKIVVNMLKHAKTKTILARGVDGSISCHKSKGCVGLSIKGVSLVCDHRLPAQTGPVQVSGTGAVLGLSSVNFAGCSSIQDGSCVRAYDGASAIIFESTFTNSSSEGDSGAVAGLGAQVQFFKCSFVSCATTTGSGGAVFCSAFLSYPQVTAMPSSMHFSNCWFEKIQPKGDSEAL